MKRVLSLFLLVFTVMSCSKGLEKNLLGAWSYNTVTLNGKTSTYEHVENCQKDYFRFSIEGSEFYMYEEFTTTTCDNCNDCPVIGTVREWELIGEKVNLYVATPIPSLKFTIIDVNENLLRYSYEADYDKDGTIDQVEITALRYSPD